MNFPWERETGNLLRAAESLLEPAAFAWFAEVLPVIEQSDPAAAVDRLLQTAVKHALDSGSEPEVLSASTRMFEPGHNVPTRIAASGRQDTFPSAVHAQAEHIPAFETRVQDKKSSWLGSSSKPLPKGDRPSPEVQTPLQKNPEQLSSRSNAGRGKQIGSVPRLIRNFSELQNLFGAVVVHNRSEEFARDDGFGGTGGTSTENPNSINSSEQAMSSREDDPRQQDFGHIAAETRRVSPGAGVSTERFEYLERRHAECRLSEVPEPAIADACWNYTLPGAVPAVAPAADNVPARVLQNPWSDPRRMSLSTKESAAGPMGSLQDVGWEEVLFDRLLARWEERLREQAIRHSGFTGGLI